MMQKERGVTRTGEEISARITANRVMAGTMDTIESIGEQSASGGIAALHCVLESGDVRRVDDEIVGVDVLCPVAGYPDGDVTAETAWLITEDDAGVDLGDVEGWRYRGEVDGVAAVC